MCFPASSLSWAARISASGPQLNTRSSWLHLYQVSTVCHLAVSGQTTQVHRKRMQMFGTVYKSHTNPTAKQTSRGASARQHAGLHLLLMSATDSQTQSATHSAAPIQAAPVLKHPCNCTAHVTLLSCHGPGRVAIRPLGWLDVLPNTLQPAKFTQKRHLKQAPDQQARLPETVVAISMRPSILTM